jgi:hypothetical protein
MPGSPAIRQGYYAIASFTTVSATRWLGVPLISRSVGNYRWAKALSIDIDVKPGCFAATDEGMAAVRAVLAQFGVRPSLIVYTSAPVDHSRLVEYSGFHVYIVLTRPVTLAEHRALSGPLIAVLERAGVHFDAGVTRDPVRFLRFPGSLNRKTDDVRVARYDMGSLDGPSYDPAELRVILERHAPPSRGHNNPPSDDRGSAPDLAEIESAALFLLERGEYGPSKYFSLRPVFFGLALAAYERPEIHDQARDLFDRVATATGRDRAHALHWFDDSVRRAAVGLTERQTLRTTFWRAYQLGWRPAVTEEQELAIAVGKSTLSSIFDLSRSRSEAIERAARLINGTVDRLVRRRLGYSCAQSMLIRSYPTDIVLSALSAATGMRVTRVPDFLLKARHG